MRHTYTVLSSEALEIITNTGTDSVADIHAAMSDREALARLGIGDDLHDDAVEEVSEWSAEHLWAYRVHEDGEGVHAWEGEDDYLTWQRQI